MRNFKEVDATWRIINEVGFPAAYEASVKLA